ncbi:hypothetical Protein YC6258_03509 [Gynuella sunshinyii YC6258]|uniref:Uncharacterized protein n=1 Tax=Gynuella sunshinyii YC6258 TaxID=1445510 RepID=A0A0C5V800_9GAMM|nr:hypothetical Protein YC6258_03509 [Gynuella sunshinyii YC6258]
MDNILTADLIGKNVKNKKFAEQSYVKSEVFYVSDKFSLVSE